MRGTSLRTLLVALTLIAGHASAAGGVVVIGDARLARLDAPTLEKIYLGRVIEVDGIRVTAVNASSGSSVRNRFLQTYIRKDDDSYTGYWSVRRYSGLGVPPRELSGSTEVIDFVKSTPGAIGYIDEADVPPGVSVLLK
jgi:ABC-type phosphate transport system substrate-binding protein